MSSTGIRVRCLASTRIATKTSETIAKDAKGGESDLEGENESRVDDSLALDKINALGITRCGPQQTCEEREENATSEDEDVSHTESSSESASESKSRSSTDGSQYAIGEAVKPSSQRHVSCIQEAQLSPDGTCIFTTDYERTFSVYHMDSDIFEEKGTRPLKPYAQSRSADPIWAFAVNSWFDVNDANTTTVLISRRDQYISLHNALWDTSRPYSAEEHVSRTEPVDISNKLASYKLIDPLTEAVMAPLSLAYSRDGAYFYAGYQNSIAIFDLSYTQDPVITIPTIPSTRSKLKGGGRGFKGHISALSVSPSSTFFNAGILAAGARTRYVGLYDGVSGEEITHFALPGTSNGYKVRDSALNEPMGQAVTHLKWSADGNYLYIAERNSDAILIYDVRKYSLALGYCTGRAALTKQKLGIDVWSAAHTYDEASQEVWAGGTDGKIRVWRDPYLKEGRVEADEVIEVSDGPVVSALVHLYGGLAVAASGAIELHKHDEGGGKIQGKTKGGGRTPAFKEWGCLDILGLGSY